MNRSDCPAGRQNLPFRIAAPSWLVPGSVSENCAFIDANLRSRVDEIALMLLETESCLAYTAEELLPPWLVLPETEDADVPDADGEELDAEPGEAAETGPQPLGFHAHLPLDLPWELGLDKAWRKVDALLVKIAPLRPRRYVLHPPEGISLRLLAGRFAAAGVDPRSVLLENVQGCDLTEIWPEVLDSGFGACVDLGHVLLYHQYPMLALPGLERRVDMLHLSAPDPTRPGRHLPLTELDETGRMLLGSMLGALTHGATIVPEVFDVEGFTASLDLLPGLLPDGGGA